ncbi:MAG: hypothetical protein KDB33_19120, partial [Acidimicrobiales bacterium]|nr:hypothetical protein [Acidimicrobiales bacterium]
PGTTAMADEEAAVLEAVDGYWRTWLAANDPPDPDHPDLEKYATGAALEQARSETSRKAAEGLATRIPSDSAYGHSLSDPSINGTQSSVTDCAVDDLLQVNTATGVVLNDAVVTELLTINLTKDADQWRVESIDRIQQWQGVNDSCS